MPKVRRPIVQKRAVSAAVGPLARAAAATARGAAARPTASAPAAAPARVILFVSPDPGDGKSTIVGGPRAGAARRRRARRDGRGELPASADQSRLSAGGQGGWPTVLSGRLDLEEAMQRCCRRSPASRRRRRAAGRSATAVAVGGVGSLFLLAGDRSVANPPALLAQEAMADLLARGARFDSC